MSVASGGQSAPPSAWGPLAAIGVVSAAAAVFVGVVYAAGVAETAIRLGEADLALRDALSLIPLQTLLIRGMGVIFVGGLAFFFFLVSLWTYTPNIPKPRRVIVPRLRTEKRTPGGDGDGLRAWLSAYRTFIFLVVLVWLSGTLIYDPLASLRLPLAFVGGAVTGNLLAQHRRRAAGVAVGVVVLVWIALNALRSLAYPVPLPNVQLELRSAPVIIEGSLVAHDGGTWYLTNRPGEVIALAAVLVKQATITSAEVPEGRTIWELVGLDDPDDQ